MSNQNSFNQAPQDLLKQMDILYLSMLGGQLILPALLFFMAGLTVVEIEESAVSAFGGIDPILIFACLIFFASVSASFYIFNKRKVEGAHLTGSLAQKLEHYRISFVIRAALLEGPNLVMILLYFFAKESIILILLFGFGMILFALIRPTTERIVQDYGLSGVEQSELRASRN